jgi:hypothetical protein
MAFISAACIGGTDAGLDSAAGAARAFDRLVCDEIKFGRMELDVTIDDPKAYTRPWKSETVMVEAKRVADPRQRHWLRDADGTAAPLLLLLIQVANLLEEHYRAARRGRCEVSEAGDALDLSQGAPH